MNFSNDKQSAIDSKVPMLTNVTIGLQHLFTIFPALVAIPMILGAGIGLDPHTIALMISANILTSGVAILIQVYGIGSFAGVRMPLVMGPGFVPLGAMIVVGIEYGLPTLFGAVIGAAFVICAASFFMNRIMKFFPKVVTGTFVTFIGISMAPVAFSNIAGGIGAADFGSLPNMTLGLGTMFMVIMLNKYGNWFVKSVSLLIGMAVGTVAAFAIGIMEMPALSGADSFALVTPFKFGIPEFEISSIFILSVFGIVTIVQNISNMVFLDKVCGVETDPERMGRGIRAQAAAQLVAGSVGAMPPTMFTENISIISLSGVTARSTVAFTGIVLVAISLFPKLALLFAAIPKPVIGGATIALFGTISAAGISMLSEVDYSDSSNFLIVGTGLAIGVGAMFTQSAFEKLPPLVGMLAGNGLFVVCVVTVSMHIIFNMLFKQKQ